MLVVIFGAGASYDSLTKAQLHSPVGGVEELWVAESRPPLANQLFDTRGRPAFRDATSAFPLVTPALMQAMADVAAGTTIEEAMTELQERGRTSARGRAQLMAIRFYLQRVLTVVPSAWEQQANGETAYVGTLDQLERWSGETGEPFCLITFNYDLLLEEARSRVFGAGAHTMHIDNYVADGPPPAIYKPHGSVNWGRRIPWASGGHSGDDARRVICEMELDATEHGPIDVRRPADAVIDGTFRSSDGGQIQPTAWLPAIAIPVEAKPGLVMPDGHLAALKRDLFSASAVVAIGWRAREAHFLDVLRDNMQGDIPLYAVAESERAADETLNNLSETQKFSSYVAIGGGFAAFAAHRPTADRFSMPEHTGKARLGHILDTLAKSDGYAGVTGGGQPPKARFWATAGERPA
jgi:hypothetical protein